MTRYPGPVGPKGPMGYRGEDIVSLNLLCKENYIEKNIFILKGWRKG